MIDPHFYTALKSTIGSLSAYPIIAGKNAKTPFSVYMRVSTQRSTTLDGPDGLAVASYRVDIYDSSLSNAQAIAHQVCTGLSAYKAGPIHYISVQNEQNGSDMSGSPDLYRIILDVDVHYAWL